MRHFVARQSDAVLREWDQIDAAIVANESLLAALKQRRAEIERQVDEMTRPQESLPLEPPTEQRGAGESSPLDLRPGIHYRGEYFPSRNTVSVDMSLLRIIFAGWPGRRETVAAAMSLAGRRRRYLARARSALFQGKDREWIGRYSKELVEGWWLDTNLSEERMRRLAGLAMNAVGLRDGTDIRIRWS